jgi:lysophospholipase L1-like esterase
LTALAPNLCIVFLGTNDREANIVPSTYAASLTTVAGMIRTAMPRCDILFVAPPENGNSATYTMRQYGDAMLGVATINSGAFMDLVAHFDTYTIENARGLWNDTKHVNTVGGQKVANLLARLIKAV